MKKSQRKIIMINEKELLSMRKTTSSSKSTFTAKIDKELSQKFNEVKREHKAAGLAPFDMDLIIEKTMKTLIEVMKKEISDSQ